MDQKEHKKSTVRQEYHHSCWIIISCEYEYHLLECERYVHTPGISFRCERVAKNPLFTYLSNSICIRVFIFEIVAGDLNRSLYYVIGERCAQAMLIDNLRV